MHSDVPSSNLRGFSNMTAVLAFCANKPVHLGGAYKL
jgi:hypothetical protein